MFNQYILSLKNNFEFIRNVAVLMSGNVIGQALTFLLTPIITRLFTPADYGVLALFIAIHGMINQWSTFTYAQSIVLPKEDEEAVGLVSLSGVCLIFVCGLVAFCVFVSEKIFPEGDWVKQLGPWLHFISPILFVSGLGVIASSWNTRKKQFKLISIGLITSVALTGTTRIWLGSAMGSSVFGLMFGFFLGILSTFAVQFRGFDRKLVAMLFNPKWSELKEYAKKYIDFPRYNMPTKLITSITQNLPVLMLGNLFGIMVVGYYALTRRMITLPTQLLSRSTQRVFLQKLAELHSNKKSMDKAFLKTTFGLLGMGLLPTIIILFWGETLASVFLGNKWQTSGTYAAIISPWILSRMVVQPANAVFVVLMKQKILFRIQVLVLLAMGVFFLVAKNQSFSPEKTLFLFMIISMLSNLSIVLRAYLYIALPKERSL